MKAETRRAEGELAGASAPGSALFLFYDPFLAITIIKTLA